MRALIFGAGGLLGQPLVRELERRRVERLALDHAAADVADRARVSDAVRSFRPDVIFNCAAFTRVDDCEEQSALAHEINGKAVGYLAAAARAASAVLVHVSTDFVFDGAARLPYLEESRAAPLQVYGQSKLEGERQALEWERSIVVRTSWLFGAGAPSFVATIVRLLTKPAPVRVVDDQVGCPTYTGHLAPALVAIAERGLTGVLHVAGGGRCSWLELAEATFAEASLACTVRPQSTAALGRPAPRPAFSALASTRGDAPVLPPWREGLRAHLARVEVTA
jgi:dTDP-4-dehydrorhamnose reductase